MATGKRRTTAKEIAEDLIGRIQRGELPQGERLREEALAKQYGTSRGPVREALQTLAGRLWITSEPGRGAHVTRLEDEQSIDAVAMSSVLFGLTCRFAAMRATAEEQEEITRIAAALHRQNSGECTAIEFLGQAQKLWFAVTYAARSDRLRLFFDDAVRGALHSFAPEAFDRLEARRAVADLWTELAVAIKARDANGAESIGKEMLQLNLKEILRQHVRRAQT